MGPIELNNKLKFCGEICFSNGNKKVCMIKCIKEDPSPPPPPPPPPPPFVTEDNELFPIIVVIVGCVLGGAIILGIFIAFIREYCYKNSRRRNSTTTTTTTTTTPIIEDFIFDHDDQEFVDHPIWYINTIGFQQSVIDLIAIVKYDKGQGLIQGTDCSVCLGEFLDDDQLRLLPKCSHAFHVLCIDTWLRSHKNCPLCRAPVINDPAIANFDHVVVVESDQDNNTVDDSESDRSEVELRTIRVEPIDVNSSEISERMEGVSVGDLPIVDKDHGQNSGSLVVDSSNDNPRLVNDENLQPVRRSVSLDSSADSIVLKDVYWVEKCEDESSLNELSSINDSKQMGENSSMGELTKSSSVVAGPSKESSGRFFFLSRSRRSQSLVLPL